MKKMMILALTLLSFQSAFADMRGPGPGRDRDRDDLPMCLKNLDNANRRITDLQIQLDNSRRPGPGSRCNPRENEELRRENQRLNGALLNLQDGNSRLSLDNNRLINDNSDLRRQLDDLQNGRNDHTLGFFSYAGCKDFSGNIDLKQIISSEGRMALESETIAKQKLIGVYSCSYGIMIGKTEEIRSAQANSFCVAGCKDFSGNIDQKAIKSGTGRNVTEAQYNALKAVTANFSCSYGVQVQACQ